MKPEPIQGVNLGYVVELYERYLENPDSVDRATRAVFDTWRPVDAEPREPREAPEFQTIVGTANLAECIRRYGHLAAQIDPLGSTPPGDPSLLPEAHGVTEEDLRALPASIVGGFVAETAANAFEAIEKLRRVYCSTSGFDFAHVFVPEERVWLRAAAESGRFLPVMDGERAEALLERLTEVEVFEQFRPPRISRQNALLARGTRHARADARRDHQRSRRSGSSAHDAGDGAPGSVERARPRARQAVRGDSGGIQGPRPAREVRLDLGWRGDVKYHAGARTSNPRGQMFVTLVPNPSHLEAVNPVVEGMARAAGTQANRPGAPDFDSSVELPLLIHGDAAFPAQGVVAETLNLSRLAAYDTGGTIHIIANNQIGFTATPAESYSTSYASGLARGFKIPIVHVNADDPVACIEAARMAWEYRARFRRDFLIDLVGYRRYGHNEGDEPAFTQPLLAQKIAEHPSVRSIWAQTQASLGQIPSERADALVKACFSRLEAAYESLKDASPKTTRLPDPAPAGVAGKTDTAVPLDRLRTLNDALLAAPPGFTFHKKLERARAKRREVLADPRAKSVDWTTAEELAFASCARRRHSRSGSLAKTQSEARSVSAMRFSTMCARADSSFRCRSSRERAPHSRSTTVRCRSAPPLALNSATTCTKRAILSSGKRSTATL